MITKTSKIIRYAMITIVLGFFAFFLVSCGKKETITYKDLETEIQNAQLEKTRNALRTYLLVPEENADAQTSVYAKINSILTNEAITNTDEFLDNALNQLEALAQELGVSVRGVDREAFKDEIKNAQLQGAKLSAIDQIDRYIEADSLEDYQNELIEKAKVKYLAKLDTATQAAKLGLVRRTGSSCTGATVQSVNEAEFEATQDVYKIVYFYTIQADRYRLQPAPIQFYGFGNGFWGHLFNNFFTFPVGWVLKTLSKLLGGYYVIGLILTTLLVRTLGWPIYARTNDMSLKMQLMQPELAKLEAKYERRTDPESQKAKQMEMAAIYRKYKVGIGGCLLPFLQFPIFMSIFRAISCLPYTNGEVSGTANWIEGLNTKVFGIDLFKDRTQGDSWQMWGVIILAVLVVGTQLLSQFILQRKQKKLQEESQANIPAYRRQAVAQESETQKTMKYTMYFMTIMMGMFVLSSAAGLGFYWLIGNIYTMFQSYIGQKQSAERLERLRNKHAK